MFKRKSNAFTLIELIATLVIMAIIALIVTPLVMSIIRKARISADKRSIDAYGRSIELAIAGYLMDNGSFPTSIEQLTIEYSGDEVVCSTTQLNSDSSVYLAGCTVGGRNVGDYTYGSDNSPSYTVYNVGDEVTYNNVDYYVIENSGASSDKVKLLKADPLTTAEANHFGAGHINNYVPSSESFYQQANDNSGYGSIPYYENENCHYAGAGSFVTTGCSSNYNQSVIKYVVDAWATAEAPGADTARLITIDELLDNLGFEYYEQGTSSGYRATESSPRFMNDGNYSYWTMSAYNDDNSKVWYIRTYPDLSVSDMHTDYSCYASAVRPVIVLPKSALSS